MKMKPFRNDDRMDSISGNSWKSRGYSDSSTGTRRRGSRENREIYAELKAKADEIEKEFEAHKRRISRDRSDSGPWSKVTVEANREKKGGDRGRSNSLRGELYDKYVEKRNARLRTNRGLKLAAMNEEKLRAMWDELERRRGEMQGKVVLPVQTKISGTQRRLQKFLSLNTRSSPTSEERGVDICLLEEDEDLMKYQQKSTQREQSISEASKREDGLQISRSHGPRKDLPVRNQPSSSVAQAVAPLIQRPLNRSTGYSSARQRENPENPLVFRKENTKPPPVIGRKANQSITRNIVQTRIASEGPEKLRFAKKSLESPLGYKNSSERNSVCQKVRYSMSFESEPSLRKAKLKAFVYEPLNGKSQLNLSSDMDELANIAKVDVMSMMFDEEENDQDLLEKFSKSVNLDPFLGNSLQKNTGNVASFNMENRQDCGNLTVSTNDAGNTGKISCFVLRNDEHDLGDSAIAANDSQDQRSSRESDESGNFESTNRDSLGSQSCIQRSVDSASEWPNSSDLKNSKPVSVENPNGILTTSAIADMISCEADTNQIQRDIEIPPNTAPHATYSHGRSQKGIMNSFRRFLVLSKKGRGDECLADWLSTTTSEGDDIFSESIVLEEQVRSLHFPVPAPSERIKHKVGYASERSLKVTRSFFSLHRFGAKGITRSPDSRLTSNKPG